MKSAPAPFPSDDRVVPWKEAAKILGISVWTLKRLGESGKIKVLRLSPRRLGVRSSEITRFTNETSISAKAAA